MFDAYLCWINQNPTFYAHLTNIFFYIIVIFFKGKAKGIGAIGQEFYGKDAENKQVCALCPFVATTKNPYRHLQDHFGKPKNK